jgi:hypothetical protein
MWIIAVEKTLSIMALKRKESSWVSLALDSGEY